MNHDPKYNEFEYEKKIIQKHRNILNNLLQLR